jgi:predicted nucleic-acid-binding protein
MIAVDTNIVLRLMVNDDTRMSEIATRLLSGEGIFVARTVLLECHWVLTSCMGCTAIDATARIARIVGHAGLRVEGGERTLAGVAAAVDGLDFEDALHLCGTPENIVFATFDKKLKSRATRMAFPITVVSP